MLDGGTGGIEVKFEPIRPTHTDIDIDIDSAAGWVFGSGVNVSERAQPLALVTR